jgi:transcriptional regulator with XRE-family HTH domain
VGRKRTEPSVDSTAIHDKLRRLVTKRGVRRTDAQVAEQAGITPVRFSLILSGKADPRISEVLAILEAIDATLGQLDRA